IASLKDTEDPEIDEPEKFRAGIILKRPRRQFGAKRGGKKRKWPDELQSKKAVHETTSHNEKTLAVAYVKNLYLVLKVPPALASYKHSKPWPCNRKSLSANYRNRVSGECRNAQLLIKMKRLGVVLWLIVRRPFNEPPAAVEEL